MISNTDASAVSLDSFTFNGKTWTAVCESDFNGMTPADILLDPGLMQTEGNSEVIYAVGCVCISSWSELFGVPWVQ